MKKYEVFAEQIEIRNASIDWTDAEIIDELGRKSFHDPQLIGSFDTYEEARAEYLDQCRMATTSAAGAVILADVVTLDLNEYDENGDFDQGENIDIFAEPYTAE